MTKNAVRYTALLALLVLGACAGASSEPESPSAAPSPTDPTASPVKEVDYVTCTNTAAGYRIDYPEDWTITTGLNSCRWADPERFFVEPGTDGPSTAITVFDSPDPYAEVVSGTFDELFYTTILREETEVSGRPAVKFEVTSTPNGLHDAGTRSYGYVIDRFGNGFVVSTEGPPGDTGYEENKKALETAIKTLEFFPPEP